MINDASNIIITNNKSDLTYVKFNKVNNKAKSPINISEIIQKTNQSKSKNMNNQNLDENKKSNNNNNQAVNQNINRQNNNEQKSLNNSISFTGKNYCVIKLNRFFSIKIKIVILIIFSICSVLFLGLNIFDYILFMKYGKLFIKKDFLMCNFTLFLLQIIFSFFVLLYQGILLFINQGEKNNFIIVSIIIIFISTSLRIYIYLTNIKLSISVMLNLVYSIFVFFINIVFLLILIIANKKKKNVLQNIDEIVYFTENNIPNEKKEKNIYNNNSPNDKILNKVAKSVQLVEDDNDIKKKNGCK